MNKVLLVPLIIVSCFLQACSGGNSSNTTSTTQANPGPTDSSINDELKKLSYNVDKANSDGFIDVIVGPDDISVLVSFALKDPSKAILVTEIRDPDNAVIYSADVDLATGEEGSIVSEFADTPYGNQGDGSVFLPPNPNLELREGTYRLSFIRQDDNPLRQLNVLVKSLPGGISLDAETYKADMNIWIAHPNAAFKGEAFKRLMETEYKDSINRILAPHALSIDKLTFYTATDTETAQFTDLNVESSLGNACQAMLKVVENKLALNLAYVRNLLSSNDQGGTAGVSPAPGTIMIDQSSNSCFAVAQRAYVTGGEDNLTEDEAIQMMAGNILHEAGHFISLEHVTEQTGDDFDFFADTPQCDAATYDGRDDPLFGFPGTLDGIVTDFECGIEGGAQNFLFYGGVPNFLPFVMSADQATTFRRHPLFSRVK